MERAIEKIVPSMEMWHELFLGYNMRRYELRDEAGAKNNENIVI